MSRCAGPRATDRDTPVTGVIQHGEHRARHPGWGARPVWPRPAGAASFRPRPAGAASASPSDHRPTPERYRHGDMRGKPATFYRTTPQSVHARANIKYSHSRRRRRRRHLIRLTSGLSGHSHGSTTISTSPSCAYSALTRSPGLISLVLHICPVATSSPALRYRPPGRLLRWLTTHASASAGPP